MNEPIIMVIEDDPAIRNMIIATLETQHYRYLAALEGETAPNEAMTLNPDMVVLDLGLANADGIEIIKKIRAASTMPILVIGSRSDNADKIDALDAGADDYLTKPFFVEELLERLHVAQRRLSRIQDPAGKEPTEFVNGDLKIDYTEGRVYLGGEEILLTPVEYKLIVLLSKNIGKVLTYTLITRSVWGRVEDDDVASMRVAMTTLRKKIEKNISEPKYIKTQIGIGYRMFIV